MKIIVGLGNPGRRYEQTRHNAGFMTLDALAKTVRIDVPREKHHALVCKAWLDSTSILLVKPQTYMNDSGKSVGAVIRDMYAPISDLVVIHDDLDLPLGAVRVKIGGGHGGHNGIRSILEHVEPDFIRVRVGIGRPEPGEDAADYVLSPFREEEKRSLPEVLARAAEAVKAIVSEGPSRAMNLFNQR